MKQWKCSRDQITRQPKMYNVLITSAGRRVSLVKAFQNEIKAFSKEAKVITVDMNPAFSAACEVADSCIKVKPLNDPNYLPDLLNIALENSIKIIIPTLDTELILLSQNKEIFEKNGIDVVVSTPGFIEKCRDKRLTNLFFKERGIDIPMEVDRHNPSFPLFIKPYDGSLSADIFLIKNEKELTSYHLDNPKFMFMEYLNKSEYDEFTIDMYYGKDNYVKCIVPRKRIEIRGGEISKGITIKNELVEFLKSKMNHIEGAVGCLTVQVFRNKISKRVIGIEINPRFGGGYPLSYHANANYPKFIFQEYFSNERIEYSDSWEEGLLMLRYDAEILVHGVSTK